MYPKEVCEKLYFVGCKILEFFDELGKNFLGLFINDACHMRNKSSNNRSPDAEEL
jgi:hypothetical protein